MPSSYLYTSDSPHANVFSLEILEERSGFILARIAVHKAARHFARESGGHRWQRVPPTEKRGRVHTSTITVAVLAEPERHEFRLDPGDLVEVFTGGGGKGGQHQNKRSTTVVLTHKPTGLRVRVESRSQRVNRQTALEILTARVAAAMRSSADSRLNQARRALVGSGMRGDKVRTVQVRNDLVIDHQSGRRTTYRRYERGHLGDLR